MEDKIKMVILRTWESIAFDCYELVDGDPEIAAELVLDAGRHRQFGGDLEASDAIDAMSWEKQSKLGAAILAGSV